MKGTTPKQGYDTPEKQLYREKVYDILLHNYTSWGRMDGWGKIDGDQRIFIMPSIEGKELEFLIKSDEYLRKIGMYRRPINEENIIVCNNNPAIVATLKRKYPKIKTYGIDVWSAIKKIDIETTRLFENDRSNFYQIRMFNFDLCGTAQTAQKLAEKIHDNTPDMLMEDALIAFTFVNGRDQKNEIPIYYQKHKTGFYYRLNKIMRALQFGKNWRMAFKKSIYDFKKGYTVHLMDYGKYNSGGKLPMGWCLFLIRRTGWHISSLGSNWNDFGNCKELEKMMNKNSPFDWRL